MLTHLTVPLIAGRCDRCGSTEAVWTMSWFNADIICLDCREDETHAPNYEAACAAELAAVRDGDLNFRGIGLAADDLAFLAERRRQRAELAGV